MFKIKIVLAICLAFFCSSFVKISPRVNSSISQVSLDTLNWKLLAQVRYITKPDKEYGEIEWPVISPQVKKSSGKRILMSGFVIPIDNTSYALSKNVFASCFFCGKAGPESIMGIKFRDKKTRLKTDTYVTLEGNFRVNDKNAEDWMYHIEDAVIISRK